MSDPTIREAEAALRQLSDDPIAREYAYRRELELIHLQNQLALRHEQGLEQGLERGHKQGREEATIAAIATLCDVFDIELSDARRAQLTSLDFDALQGIHSRIAQAHVWPL